jgi:2-dehydro-3-deoxygluconokinase
MLKIACLGECMVELRHRTETELDLAFGGDTLNTAVYLARLLRDHDARIDYVTAIGHDRYSDQMLALFQAEGLNTEHVLRLKGRLPGLYTIHTDEVGERAFTYWRERSAARRRLMAARGEKILEALADHDLFYVSGITLSIFDATQRATLFDLAETIRLRGKRVAFDSNFRPAGWSDIGVARRVFDDMERHSSITLHTLFDDRALYGTRSAEACAERLQALGVGEIAVKLNREGAYVAADGFKGYVPTTPVERVVDTTAAGDSFNAGYLAARLVGKTAEEAAALGNKLAARVIGHRGAIIPKDAMADITL